MLIRSFVRALCHVSAAAAFAVALAPSAARAEGEAASSTADDQARLLAGLPVSDGSPLKAFAGQQHDAHIMNHILFGLSPMMAGMPQVAVNLQKHIFEHIRFKAEEATEAELFQQYGTDPEGLVSALQREAMIAIKVAEYYQEAKKLQTELMGPQDDPLVKVKEKEIQANAAADQAKDQNEKARIQLEGQRVQGDLALDQAKLALDAQKLQQTGQHATRQLNQQGAQHAAQNAQAAQNARFQAISNAQKSRDSGGKA